MQSPDRPACVLWVLLFGLTSFSFSPILIRMAAEAPGMTLAVWRTVFAVLILAPFALIRARTEIRSLGRRDLVLILVAGVLLGIHFVTWIESLYHTTVASASVLVTTSPIFLAVLGHVLLGEKHTKGMYASILIAVAGAILIGVGDFSGDLRLGRGALFGNGLALGASLVLSFYLIAGRVVRRKTSWIAYVFLLYGVTAVTVLAMGLLSRMPLFGFSPKIYLLCLAMALGPQILGHGSLNYALRYLPAVFVGLLPLIEPIGASAFAYLIFGERPGLISMGGMAVVLLAIAVVILLKHRAHAADPAKREPLADAEEEGIPMVD